jgi:hypothetical protein
MFLKPCKGKSGSKFQINCSIFCLFSTLKDKNRIILPCSNLYEIPVSDLEPGAGGDAAPQHCATRTIIFNIPVLDHDPLVAGV